MSALTRWRSSLLALALASFLPAHAATALRSGDESLVSQTPTPTEKAKFVRLAYVDGVAFRKVLLATYGDGLADQQNVFARVSFDEGVSWAPAVLLSRDAAGAPTGGQSVTTRDAITLKAGNDKPSVAAPPVVAGPHVMVAWSSSYCPADPHGRQAGPYASALQGTGDADADGTPDRPFHCIWVASSVDPLLAAWDVHQLTDAQRDATGEVLAVSSDGSAWAMAWQEDPLGLQPGEAEGPGDGGSGARVSGGTNIWYTHANAADGAALRSHITTLSDNLSLGAGQPGASRPALALSGQTAVAAYEESGCAGGSGGKCIVYHSFAHDAPVALSAGTVVSDVTRSARRVRIVVQGAGSAGRSSLRSLLLWRESAAGSPAAPADVVIRRGLMDKVARPGSTGLRASDLLADRPQTLTHAAASGRTANAHRAIVRGSFIGLAFDLSRDPLANLPQSVPMPAAGQDLFFMRSTADGAPLSWSAPRRLSEFVAPDVTVVEPRLLATPATIVNPLTGRSEAGDVQNGQILFVAFGTQSLVDVGAAGRVYLSRSTDLGQTFEPFVPVSAAIGGQSEVQLRPTPDGSSAAVMWMSDTPSAQAYGKEAAIAVMRAVGLPDLALRASAPPLGIGTPHTLTLRVSNLGTGDARAVSVEATLPPGLKVVGVEDPSACRVRAPDVLCSLEWVASGTTTDLHLTVLALEPGEYIATARAAADWLDAQPGDNRLSVALAVARPVVAPPPLPPQHGGGGCGESAESDATHSPDPVWMSLLLISVVRIARHRRAGVVDRLDPCGRPDPPTH
jgi:hypothetical protein